MGRLLPQKALRSYAIALGCEGGPCRDSPRLASPGLIRKTNRLFCLPNAWTPRSSRGESRGAAGWQSTRKIAVSAMVDSSKSARQEQTADDIANLPTGDTPRLDRGVHVPGLTFRQPSTLHPDGSQRALSKHAQTGLSCYNASACSDAKRNRRTHAHNPHRPSLGR
jgi:hypothetical protein